MSGPFSYAHLWQQEELSDVDIVLATVGHAADGQLGESSNQLRVLPGHSVILSNIPYMHAQVSCWTVAISINTELII